MSDVASEVEHSVKDANGKLSEMIGRIREDITASIEGYTSEAGDNIHDQIREVAQDVEKIRKTLNFFDVAIEALLSKNGLESSETLYWRPWVHAAIAQTILSNNMLKENGKTLLTDDGTFEMLVQVYPGADRNLLLSLFREKVPGFQLGR